MTLPPNIQHLVAGTAGGMIATGALYPLELVKTRMQVINDSSGTYRNLGRAFRTVLRNEGFFGMYQGMGPALFAASGSWGGYFYFYERSKERKKARISQESNVKELTTVDILTSGVEAGVILVVMFNPVWVVKTRLAVQGAESGNHRARYTGTFDCIKTIIKEEGFRGLYKGLVPALFLTSHGAIQFAIYELIKSTSQRFHLKSNNNNTDKDHKQPAWVSLLNGGVSKIVASTVTYPYQLVKSKLQQRDAFNIETQKVELRYTGTLDCVKKVWRSEGIPGFFRGVLPNALKVAPSAALTFLVYEETMKLLS